MNPLNVVEDLDDVDLSSDKEIQDYKSRLNWRVKGKWKLAGKRIIANIKSKQATEEAELRAAERKPEIGNATTGNGMVEKETQYGNLTVEQVEELTEAFSLFDKSGEGTVSTKDLGALLRSLGQNWAEDKKLQKETHEVDPFGNSYFYLNDFLNMCAHHWWLEPDPNPEDILAVYQSYDKEGTGFISLFALRDILTKIDNEPLTDKEFDDMMNDTGYQFVEGYNEWDTMMGDDRFNYERWMHHVFVCRF